MKITMSNSDGAWYKVAAAGGGLEYLNYLLFSRFLCAYFYQNIMYNVFF